MKCPAPVRHAITVVLAALLLAVGALPADAEPPEPVAITLTSATPATLTSEDDLVLRGRIINHGAAELTGLTVWLRMQAHVPSEEGLADWLAAENDNNVTTLARHDLDEPLPPGESTAYQMTIPKEDSPFDYGSQWGPRGIELVVTGTTDPADDDAPTSVSAATRSTILWFPPDAAAPTPLTVAVPLSATDSEWKAALQEDQPVAQTAAGRLTDVLTELGSREVTWGVDAAILDDVPPSHLRALLPAEGHGAAAPTGATPASPQDQASGSAGPDAAETDSPEPDSTESDSTGADGAAGGGAPASGLLTWQPSARAAELAEAIAGVGGEGVISLGWARPDLAALLGAGDQGRELLGRAGQRSSDTFERAGIPVRPGVVWSFTPLDSPAAARLGESVTDVIMPPAASATSLTPPTAGHLTLHTPDEELTDLLLSEVSAPELYARTALAATAGTDKRSAEADAPHALLATLPADITGEQAARLAKNLDLLDEAPWIEVSALPAEPSTAGLTGYTPARPGSLTPADIAAAETALARAEDFATLTENPDSVLDLFETTALLGASMVWRAEPQTQRDLLATLTGAAALDFLSIEQPSTVNLISRGGDLPVSVANSGPLALHPVVSLQPADARLLADEPVPATIEAGQSATIQVPITAVANGNVTATIHLLSETGRDVAEPQELTVRVRADWETTGTAVLAGIVLLGFVYGLFRNIRSANVSGRHPRRHDG